MATDKARQALEKMAEEGSFDFEALEQISEQLAARKATALIKYKSPESVQKMQDLVASFHRADRFKTGDIVRYKHGLKNKRGPAYDVPAIVVEVLESPRENRDASSGSTYFHERLDMIIGYFLDAEPEDESLAFFHVDSRRFELHPDHQTA